jgi:uncharacterized membrane protein
MQRIKSLDLARGFTVLMIAPIHTVMLYSNLEIRNTLLVNLLAFIAEWHGAQIFMTLMGISFTFSKKHDFERILKRATILLAVAYVLNIFKFVIPHLLGLLPQSLLNELQVQNGWYGFVQLFLIGDILHFASIASVILFIVYKQKNYQWIALAIAFIICISSPFIWDMYCRYLVIDYFLQIVGGQPPHIYFPLFPWLVYPLVGLAIGYWFQKTKHQKVFWLLRDIGWMLIIFSLSIKFFLKENQLSIFYRTNPIDSILHVGFVFVALSIWHWISLNVKQNHFFRLLIYLSENITQVYIIQWVIICWMLPVFGYQTLRFIPTLFCIMLTSFMTMGISFSISVYGKKNI